MSQKQGASYCFCIKLIAGTLEPFYWVPLYKWDIDRTVCFVSWLCGQLGPELISTWSEPKLDNYSDIFLFSISITISYLASCCAGCTCRNHCSCTAGQCCSKGACGCAGCTCNNCSCSRCMNKGMWTFGKIIISPLNYELWSKIN